MADAVLNVQVDSGKAEQWCKFCFEPLLVQNNKTKFCSDLCREESLAGFRRMKVFNPDMAVIACKGCNSAFIPTSIKALFCDNECFALYFAKIRNETGQGARISAAYRLRNPEKVLAIRSRSSKKMYAKLKADNGAFLEWRRVMTDYQTPEKMRSSQRKRNAKSALSAILLPVQEHPRSEP